jgi:hypothetical protein
MVPILHPTNEPEEKTLIPLKDNQDADEAEVGDL